MPPGDLVRISVDRVASCPQSKEQIVIYFHSLWMLYKDIPGSLLTIDLLKSLLGFLKQQVAHMQLQKFWANDIQIEVSSIKLLDDREIIIFG